MTIIVGELVTLLVNLVNRGSTKKLFGCYGTMWIFCLYCFYSFFLVKMEKGRKSCILKYTNNNKLFIEYRIMYSELFLKSPKERRGHRFV